MLWADGVPCHRGWIELANARWLGAVPGRDVSGGRDVGLAAQVPYWSEDVVASGGLLRGKGPQLGVRALVQPDDVAIHFACAVLHYDEQ